MKTDCISQQLNHLHNEYNLTSPNSGHTTGGAGRVGAGLCMAELVGTSTVWFAQDTSVPGAHKVIGNNFFKRLFGNTNSRIRT